MRSLVLCCVFVVGVARGLESPSEEARQHVKSLYEWDSIDFEDELIGAGFTNQPGAVSNFDYDPYTGFLCLALKRSSVDQRCTVACFDSHKYKPLEATKPLLQPFPSLEDNQLPLLPNAPEEPVKGRHMMATEQDFGKDYRPKLRRVKGKQMDIDDLMEEDELREGGIVSEEKPFILEGNEHSHPVHEKTTEVVDHPPPAQTVPLPVQRKQFNFVSVTKVWFDDCGRFWLLDRGFLEKDGVSTFYRPPTLWAFEVTTKKERKLLSKLYLRHEFASNSSAEGLSDFVVDVYGSDCDVLNVYLANYKDGHILVYDNSRSKDYVIDNPVFKPIPTESHLTFEGHEYNFPAGVYSLALGGLADNGFRDLFFSLGSGQGEYFISTKILRQITTRKRPHSIGYKGCGTTTLNHVYDPISKVMFFMDPRTSSVLCWNTELPLNPNTIGTVYVDESLKSGWTIKMDLSNNLWFMANNYNMYNSKFLDAAGFKLRLYRAKVREIIQDTVCQSVQVIKKARPEEDQEDETYDEFIDPLLEAVSSLIDAIDPSAEEPLVATPAAVPEVVSGAKPVSNTDPIVAMVMETSPKPK